MVSCGAGTRAALRSVATTLALAVCVGVSIYGLYLLLVGQEWIFVEEGTGISQAAMEPTFLGLVPFTAGLLGAVGIVLHRRLVAWAGWGLMMGFAVAFVFGVGGVLLPVAALLALLMVVMGGWRPRRLVEELEGGGEGGEHGPGAHA
jgi:hypothetical protein